ncbi:hypothetical protein AALB47_06950 [Lachnospiraceae bacterium 54-11]
MAVLKMHFLSEALGMQTNVTICLPTFSFEDSFNGHSGVYIPGMKYPVMYLLNGGSRNLKTAYVHGSHNRHD